MSARSFRTLLAILLCCRAADDDLLLSPSLELRPSRCAGGERHRSRSPPPPTFFSRAAVSRASQRCKGCRREQAIQCLGFCTADLYTKQDRKSAVQKTQTLPYLFLFAPLAEIAEKRHVQGCKHQEQVPDSRNPRLAFYENPADLLVQSVEKEQVWPFFGCCTAYSQTDTGRHQVYNNDSLVLFSTAWPSHFTSIHRNFSCS